MAFYLRPPSGSTQYHRLERYAMTRLSFLLQLLATRGEPVSVQDLLTNQATVEDSDCLIEGSRWDRISHFVLRLSCSGEEEMREFLIQAETLLFEVRFLNMTQEELINLLHTVKPILNKSGIRCHDHVGISLSAVIGLFDCILRQFGSWEKIVGEYLSGSNTTYIQVPFQFVLDLVKSRAVTLEKGTAFVPVNKLRQVFTTVFEILLRKGIRLAQKKYEIVVEDNRIKLLFAKLKCLYGQSGCRLTEGTGPLGRLCHTDTDEAVELFPPCMQHLHRILRRDHRLSHHARVQYSLYLKEAGLPVHEALMFWRQEYSLSSGDQKSCRHDWQHDGKRYTYNIRHLYGLEGSRINYRAHCCRSIQGRPLSAGEEGGCPFVHFDNEHLQELFYVEGINSPAQERIIKSVSKGNHQSACQLYLHAKLTNLVRNEILDCSMYTSLSCHSDKKTDQRPEPRSETEIDLFKSCFNPCKWRACKCATDNSTVYGKEGMKLQSSEISRQTCSTSMVKPYDLSRNCASISEPSAPGISENYIPEADSAFLRKAYAGGTIGSMPLISEQDTNHLEISEYASQPCSYCANRLKAYDEKSTPVLHTNLSERNVHSIGTHVNAEGSTTTNSELHLQMDVDSSCKCFNNWSSQSKNTVKESTTSLKLEKLNRLSPGSSVICKPIDYYASFKKLLLDLDV